MSSFKYRVTVSVFGMESKVTATAYEKRDVREVCFFPFQLHLFWINEASRILK